MKENATVVTIPKHQTLLLSFSLKHHSDGRASSKDARAAPAMATHQDAVKSTTTNFSLDCSINSIHSPSDSTYFTMLVPFDDDDLLPIE